MELQDPRILCLLPESTRLWQSNLLACKLDKSQTFTVLESTYIFVFYPTHFLDKC